MSNNFEKPNGEVLQDLPNRLNHATAEESLQLLREFVSAFCGEHVAHAGLDGMKKMKIED